MKLRGSVLALALLGIFLFTAPKALPAATARQAFDKAVSNFQASPDDTLLRRKVLTLARGLKDLPDDPDEVLVLKGKAAYIMKSANSPMDFKPAVEAYDKAILLAPWDGNLYYNLGVVQEKSGLASEAANSFKLYLLAFPDAEDRDKVLARLGKLDVEKDKEVQQQQKAVVNHELASANAADLKKWQSKKSASTVVAVLGAVALAGGALELGLGYGNESDSKFTTVPGYAGGVLYNIHYEDKYWSNASYASYTDGQSQVQVGWTVIGVGSVVVLIGLVMNPGPFVPQTAMLHYSDGQLAWGVPELQLTPNGMSAGLLHAEF